MSVNTTYTFAQLEALWTEASTTAQEAALAPIMAAIAMAESGGNPFSHNTSGEDSRGLWQINVGPGANTQYSGLNLFDPLTNAMTAVKVYESQGLGAWSTFKNGAYLAFVPAGTPLPSSGVAGTTGISGNQPPISAFATKLSPQVAGYIMFGAAALILLVVAGAFSGKSVHVKLPSGGDGGAPRKEKESSYGATADAEAEA